MFNVIVLRILVIYPNRMIAGSPSSSIGKQYGKPVPLARANGNVYVKPVFFVTPAQSVVSRALSSTGHSFTDTLLTVLDGLRIRMRAMPPWRTTLPIDMLIFSAMFIRLI
jgi:hypothetical protein